LRDDVIATLNGLRTKAKTIKVRILFAWRFNSGTFLNGQARGNSKNIVRWEWNEL
jgi:hypothetical protein